MGGVLPLFLLTMAAQVGFGVYGKLRVARFMFIAFNG